jgi:hypothetical protein
MVGGRRRLALSGRVTGLLPCRPGGDEAAEDPADDHRTGCDDSYPDFCIPPPPPDKDCGDFSQKNFRVRYDVADPDPHRLDGDKDGLAWES